MKIIIVIWVTCLCIIGYMFLHKNVFDKTTQVSYPQMYNASKYILQYKLNQANKSIDIGANIAGQYFVYKQDSLQNKYTGSKITIHVAEGVNTYIIKDSAGVIVDKVITEYITNKDTAAIKGIGMICLYDIKNKTSASFADVTHWQVSNTNNSTDILWLNVILKDSVQIYNYKTTQEKVHAIALFLCKHLLKHAGNPSNVLDGLSLQQQFEKVISSNESIWCGHFGVFTQALLQQAGIPNRYIEIKENIASSIPTHVVNEYYNTEKQQWQLLDCTYGILGFLNTDYTYKNVVDAKREILTYSNNYIVQYNNGIIDTINILKANKDLQLAYRPTREIHYYLNPNMQQVFSFNNKIKRFVTGSPYVLLHSDNVIINNINFYVKQLVIIVLAITSFLILAMLIIQGIKKANRYN